jgi:hypothetical protein
MAKADYLAKRFVGKELCVAIGSDVETITYAEVWANNKAYFRGIVRNVEDGWMELEIPGVGTTHINCESIEMVWEPPFSWRKAVRGSLTDKPIAPSGR